MRIFREHLKELRCERRLSQKQLAEYIKTTNSSISDWETGRSQPDLETLARLAVFFEVSIDYLLGLEDESGEKIKPSF